MGARGPTACVVGRVVPRPGNSLSLGLSFSIPDFRFSGSSGCDFESMSAILKSALRRYWPAGVILLAGFGLSAGLGWRFYREAVEVDRARFSRTENQIIEALDARVEKVESILRQLQDHLEPHQEISVPLYFNWCYKQDLSTIVPWCYGLFCFTNRHASKWRDALPSNVTAWTARDTELFSQFANKTPIELAPQHAYGTYFEYVWTTNYCWHWDYRDMTNRAFVEPDGCLNDNAVRTTAHQQITRSRTGEPQFGAALILPLLEPAYDTLSGSVARLQPKLPKHRLIWNTCRGILIAPIEYRVLESDIWNGIPQEVGVEIFASTQPQRESWLNPKPKGPRALDRQFRPYLSGTVLWKMYRQRWAVFIYTLPLFEEASSRRLASLTLVAGAGLTLLASALVGVALRARYRQERMTEEVTEARDALAAAEKQRAKLGHGLHDGAIQSLYAVLLKLGRAEQRVRESRSAGAPDILSHPQDAQPRMPFLPEIEGVASELSAVRTEVDAVITEIRQFILAEQGADKTADLEDVLRAMAQRASAGGGAWIDVHCESGASEQPSPLQAVQLANIAREALSNSLRHGKARQIKVSLACKHGSVRLEIADDGAGFDPKAAAGQGIGLRSMARRAAEAGGKLEVQSGLGRGTRVIVQIETKRS